MPLQPKPISETMVERLVHAIRQDVISGALEPGVRLRVAELSKRYGASHIPVREALLQLVGERLVVIEARKGAVLRPITKKFVSDIHDTRAAIEGLLASKAAERATDKQVEELQELALSYETTAKTKDAALMSDANKAFHNLIAQIADNPEAENILAHGWDLVISLRNRYGLSDDRVFEIIAQHRSIVDAIKARDPEAATLAIQRHCISARDDLLGQMLAEESNLVQPSIAMTKTATLCGERQAQA